MVDVWVCASVGVWLCVRVCVGVDEDTAGGGDIILEQVPADKPGWEVVFHFGDEELLAEGTACDGYGEIVQLEECGYAAISVDEDRVDVAVG